MILINVNINLKEKTCYSMYCEKCVQRGRQMLQVVFQTVSAKRYMLQRKKMHAKKIHVAKRKDVY